MKSLSLALVCALACMPMVAQKQAASAASVSDINATFEKAAEAAQKKVNTDRLAALEAYIGNKANAEKKDMVDAHLAAAQLGEELDKFDVAKAHAEKVITVAKTGETATAARLIAAKATVHTGGTVEQVSAFLAPLIGGALKAKTDTWGPAIEATGVLADACIDLGDKDAAIKAWKSLGETLDDERVKGHLDGKLAEVAVLGTAPQAFSVKDMAGKDLSLDQFKGKVLLIDFWATWCGPCKAELPNVIATYKKFHAQGFEILGISLDNSKEPLDAYLASHEMPWRQFFDGKGWKNEVAVLYGVQSIPATYLLDKEGKIHRMGLRGEALGKAVEKLLGAKAAPAKADPKKPM